MAPRKPSSVKLFDISFIFFVASSCTKTALDISSDQISVSGSVSILPFLLLAFVIWFFCSVKGKTFPIYLIGIIFISRLAMIIAIPREIFFGVAFLTLNLLPLIFLGASLIAIMSPSAITWRKNLKTGDVAVFE